MASDRVVERRRVFQQYKEDVKERGKPFFPYAMFHDTIMSLVVVVRDHRARGRLEVHDARRPSHGTEAGWLGKLYDAPADPGTINFVPRPDWYFYFLFYLLRIFKWPPTVILGTIGIPTICLVLLLALPFIDVRAERRPLRRPVAIIAAILVVISMGVLTYKGATAKEALGCELVAHVPSWAEKQGFEDNPQAIAGAKLFAVVGCPNCHSTSGSAAASPARPNLTAEGAKGKGIDFQIAPPEVPVVRQPGLADAVLPDLGDARLAQLAAFLEASKGGK